MEKSKNSLRVKRHQRIRNKISGTAACPRLCVFKSNTHFYAQIIDDVNQTTLASASTLKMEGLSSKSNIEAAQKVGTAIAQAAAAKNITNVVFDRSGYLYHGKVKAFADAARAAGLKF